MTTALRVPDRLDLPHGIVLLPAFLPDATQGVVRAVGADDLERVGVTALVMNVYHLMQKPGTSTVHALGGLHRMTGWYRPILTDSGGFQAYSLVRSNPKWGRITENGIRFRPGGASREFLLTPEKSVQLQMAYGADLVVCLDDCTHADAPFAEQEAAVRRTIQWAARCHREFLRQLEQRRISQDTRGSRPLLIGVVQGGGDTSLRRQCAEALLEIGFDGYGFGGWPLDAQGTLLQDLLALTRELIPRAFPMHALGVGHPESVVACVRMGYSTFDCALPTRDARHGRLYVRVADPVSGTGAPNMEWFRYLYIEDERHIKNRKPIVPGCDCPACVRYSVGYLRHLFKSGDPLFYRLATLHNLRFMSWLMEQLRADACAFRAIR